MIMQENPDRRKLKKNRLDLEFQGEAQKANAFLILLTTGILAFLGTFIWLRDSRSFYLGIIITAIASITGWLFYNKSSKRMKEILDEIENL